MAVAADYWRAVAVRLTPLFIDCPAPDCTDTIIVPLIVVKARVDGGYLRVTIDSNPVELHRHIEGHVEAFARGARPLAPAPPG